MNRNRFVTLVAIAAGFFFLCVAPGLARGQNAPVQTPQLDSSGAQPKGNALPPDDFAGLDYTDEQKVEIDQIRREAKAHKDVIAKDGKLTPDQRDAMLLGYTRVEYGQVYRVLTPEQRRQVRHRINARRTADQAAKQKQSPRN